MSHCLCETIDCESGSRLTFRLPGNLISLVKSVVTTVSISTQFGLTILLTPVYRLLSAELRRPSQRYLQLLAHADETRAPEPVRLDDFLDVCAVPERDEGEGFAPSHPVVYVGRLRRRVFGDAVQAGEDRPAQAGRDLEVIGSVRRGLAPEVRIQP